MEVCQRNFGRDQDQFLIFAFWNELFYVNQPAEFPTDCTNMNLCWLGEMGQPLLIEIMNTELQNNTEELPEFYARIRFSLVVFARRKWEAIRCGSPNNINIVWCVCLYVFYYLLGMGVGTI